MLANHSHQKSSYSRANLFPLIRYNLIKQTIVYLIVEGFDNMLIAVVINLPFQLNGHARL